MTWTNTLRDEKFVTGGRTSRTTDNIIFDSAHNEIIVTLEHLMADRSLRILVFSHRPEVREAVTNAIGRRPAPDVGTVRYVEASGVADVLGEVDSGDVDLAILDGEAQPTGGMGLARQLNNELDDCPPIVVTVRRADDRWLATWSRADAVLVHPLDPVTAARTVAEVLRSHRGRVSSS